MICPDCEGRGEVLDAPGNVLDGRSYWDVCPSCKGKKEVEPINPIWTERELAEQGIAVGKLTPMDLGEITPPEGVDPYVLGVLKPLKPFIISFRADEHPISAELSLSLKPLTPFKVYAGIVFASEVIGPGGHPTKLVIVMPCSDRRKARRVSRRSGMRFKRRTDGNFDFYSKVSV